MTMNFKKNCNEILNIPMPTSINYTWNFGSLLGMTLAIQIMTGIMLSFHYNSFSEEAFKSVIEISRNVNNGWMIRFIHINGASMFFVFLFSHISKNILVKSFKMKNPWNIGIMIIFVLMATAFMGYILPWGQMSFWAATVITNLMSAIPIWGNSIVVWLWGGFSVGTPTLTRFFSLHFLLPFLIVFLSIMHIIFIHSMGSSNPISIKLDSDKINFHPFFTSKDFIGVIFSLSILYMIIMMNPMISTDPENFIPANPMVTPIHIQPEWYFLFAYAILRSIPNKLGGVIALIMSILILSIKSMSKSKKKSSKFSKKHLMMFVMLINSFVILTWIGMKPVESPFIEIGTIYSMMYFLIMMMI